jgi:peptidoglycan hydrolase-like protein with peptidoglycan-binding domain
MATLTRTLSTGLTGPDVSDLQKQLGQLGLTVPAAEQQGSSFGQGTHDAVVQFQTANGLAATGLVDTATATAVSVAIADATYTVTGSVLSPTRVGVGGLNVQLVDTNVGAGTPLGATTTGTGRNFGLSVVIALTDFANRLSIALGQALGQKIASCS